MGCKQCSHLLDPDGADNDDSQSNGQASDSQLSRRPSNRLHSKYLTPPKSTKHLCFQFA